MTYSRIIPLLLVGVIIAGGIVYQSGILTPSTQAGAPGEQAQSNVLKQSERQSSTAAQDRTRPQSTVQRRGPPARVVVAKAVKKMLAPAAEAPGTVISMRDSRIAAEISGKIVFVAEVGDIIQKGDIIARIDPTPARLAVKEQQAQISRLKTRYEFLDDRYKRFSSLGDEFGESENSIAQMKSERDEGYQQLVSAQVALERSEFQLERTSVMAPFAGRIAARNVEIGEFANPGTQIARLVDTDNLEVRSQASANLISTLSPDDNVSVSHGNQTYISKVRAIIPVGDAISRTLELRVSLPPSTDIFVGAPVVVTVPSAKPRPAIAAHRDSLHYGPDGISVYKISSRQTASKIPVELGLADGDLIEIIGDIAPGDELVVRGGERLRPGQTVEIINNTAGPA